MAHDDTATRPGVQPPERRLRLAEGRALIELGAFVATSPLLAAAKRGDQHPVLVLPGFTASDRSTVPLRSVLRSQGYAVHGWGLGPNVGPTHEIVAGIERLLGELFRRHQRRVSIVGWSLGGIYARELARAHPTAVRQVITLGSPFRMVEGDRSAASAVADQLAHRFRSDWRARRVDERLRPPLPVPSTAVYTRTDGVCRWHTCIDEHGDTRENIEVYGSHSGLGFNPAVVYAVADRLAQTEGEWRPFVAPAALRQLYPRPTYFRATA